MSEEFALLAQIFDKYAKISKIPLDFGVGILIYPGEIHTVARLCEHGEMSVTDMAKASGVTKGAMSQLVSRLEKKGLVYKKTAPDNLSKWLIYPTELGKRAQENHTVFHQERDANFVAYMRNLSATDYKVAKALFRQMDCWLKAYP